MSERVQQLKAELAKVKAQINEIAPNGEYCKRCGATDVYWMTVSGKPILFDSGSRGGQHVCPIADDFGVVE